MEKSIQTFTLIIYPNKVLNLFVISNLDQFCFRTGACAAFAKVRVLLDKHFH